jgi:alkylation response protein AidB-like acyl-CoA dehydrogenase
VDEGVQVFGGNGYSREFPLERMYRDARITRIYEGTNEINRLLIPSRLLKQLPELFTLDAATAAGEGLPAADRSSLIASSPVAHEREFVARAKRAAVLLLAQASASYGGALKDAQEVLAQIADIIIEIYAAESGIARAEKLAHRGNTRASLAADAARVYTCDAADRIAAAARQVVAALGAEAGLAAAAARLTSLTGLTGLTPVDTISARRRIADAAIHAGRHPF